MNKLLMKVAELGGEINLDGLQVRLKNEPVFFTVEGDQLRTPVGVVPIDVTKIVEIRLAQVEKVELSSAELDDMTFNMIEDFLEENGFGLYNL